MSLIPRKLAIYYGWPSSVNGTFTVAGAAAVFADYKLVVFGAGLEESTHGDHVNTKNIINHPTAAGTRFYGYIDATLPLITIQDKIDKWFDMGVKGIFLDQFGYDFGLTRDRQNAILWCVHEKGPGLKAFVNAWNPDDVFSTTVGPSNPSGASTELGADDWYLAESFAVINGDYDDADTDSNNIKDFQDKANKLNTYKTTIPFQIAAISTYDNSAYDQNKADYSYFAAVLNNFNAWGFGEENYSAISAQLPFRPRKNFHGTNFVSSIIYDGDVLKHYTNVGIQVDTQNHTTNIIIP